MIFGRPSRVRTEIPQPAEHIAHTLLYQTATPGLNSSGGNVSGIKCSSGCRIASASMKPAPAPAPPTPTSLRKSLRATLATCFPLLVAGPAIESMLDRGLLVTVETPAHLQRGDAFDAMHGLDGTVTRLTGDVRPHVALVREVHEVRQIVHLYP